MPFLTDYHPTYFVAALAAVVSALVLRGVGVPAPWPPAIALYVFGAVAWPAWRERMPTVRPALYAAAWVSLALLVIVYETLGRLSGW